MKYWMHAAALVVMVLGQQAAAQDADARRITVVGTATTSLMPDVAIVRLGVESRDESAAVALEAMNEAIGAVIDSIGAVPGDIQTSTFTLQQDFDRSGSLSADLGYIAQSVVTVRTQDIDGLGGLLDQAVEAGANRIDGISFEISNSETALAEARQAAILQAMDKAQLFASSAGVVLGDLITMTEAGAGPGPSVRAFDSMAVEPGSVSLGARVVLVYAING